VRLRDLGEREGAVDRHIELARGHPPEEIRGALLQLLARRHVVAQRGARQEERALGVEHLRVERGDRAAGCAKEHHHATPAQAVEPLHEGGLSHTIVDDVHAGALREALHLSLEVDLGVADDGIGPEPTHARGLLLGRAGGQYCGATALGDLDEQPANTARRWISRFYLSGNILSAAKQIASVPVWANIVGFRNLARYMFDIDSAAIRELMQSPGFRARYASGWSEETANILSDHRRNPVAKLYDAGLLPNRTVDAVAGLWIAQGVYRDLKATLTDRGYSADEARSRAQTLTWNLIEQTQQSARTEMLLLIQREQPLTRVIFQFANSPIQQMQFELEAFREFKAGTPGSRPRLARALIINHVLVPAILLSIEGFFNALLGRQPEDDRWRHWLVASILGQFSALFIIGSLGERGLITLLGGKYPYWKTDELPLAGIKRPFQSAFDLIRHTALYGADALTPGDFSEVTADDILTDLHNLGRATVAPYRHISEAVRNRRD